jgi:YD repeat-containing protein
MKNILLCCLAILISTIVPAQYFYNDLVGSAETMRLMKAYRDNKVRTVSATGYDRNNVKATDFIEFHEVKDNGMTLKITNRDATSHSVTHHRFNAGGRLVTTVDSTGIQLNTLSYEYDSNGRITRIENKSTNPSDEFNITEVHSWIYKTDGRPEKMWRILSGTNYVKPDSIEIRFVPDDMGNTGDEVTFRNNRETGRVYYYYDDKGRMTDIVRFNTKLNRLLPDVMFEYDDKDRVIQKITTTSDRVTAYLIWRFVFDSRGLKTKEALFDNNKQLTGKIDYAYTFGY